MSSCYIRTDDCSRSEILNKKFEEELQSSSEILEEFLEHGSRSAPILQIALVTQADSAKVVRVFSSNEFLEKTEQIFDEEASKVD